MNFWPYIKDLPLEGEASAVEIAKDVRKKRVNEIRNGGMKLAASAVVMEIDNSSLEAMGCRTQEHAQRFVSSVCLHALRNPSAAFWLATRKNHVSAIIRASVSPCVEHFANTKPFK